MKIDEDVLKCVGFIAARRVDGSYRLCGSVFFVGLSPGAEPNTANEIVWITARHVIDGIRSLGLSEAHIRLNQRNGETRWVSTQLSEWFMLPDQTCDVAILRRDLMDWDDHKVVGPNFFLTDEVQTKIQFGVTDEVIVTGLFTHRAGNRRNVPIVRIGNIASLNHEEKVSTKLGEMPAYLIECRSIGGLSGSPVFVLTGVERALNGKVLNGDSHVYLLGLIHGHYDVLDSAIDEVDAAGGLTANRVNTGIAIVTPFWRLQKVFEAFRTQLSKVPSIFGQRTELSWPLPSELSLTMPPKAK